ncbi:MAG: topoisomerase DNA-binding C4 zinc finger domain-containing protein, partial [Chloroflexi bacterium]|nr:topoisomerase DNA-binding C4 zinc finger domain-containing protein [Chloroflexota bacterium]
DSTSVDIKALDKDKGTDYLFRATGSTVKFPGFTVVYTEGKDEVSEEEEEGQRALPPLATGDLLELMSLLPEQHFTQPPPRYTEATLIRALEEQGIGRPSTYAPILSTIQERGYVERAQGRKLLPTELGFIVNDQLVKHFPEIVDLGFTAQMEADLDRIASGEAQWVPVLKEFYQPFKATLDQAEAQMGDIEPPKPEPTGELCEKCGKPMVIKRGRFGRFIACSGFPACRNSRSFTVGTGVKCPQCKEGELVEKLSRRTRVFYSCSRYPECKYALWNRPVPQPCPACGGLVASFPAKKAYVCTACGNVIETLEAWEAVPAREPAPAPV